MSPPKMHLYAAELTYGALGKIFWGGIICAIDLNVWSESKGFGFRFDFLNDVVGASLIVWGIAELRPLVPDSDYDDSLRFCWYMAVVATLGAVLNHFIFPPFLAFMAIAAVTSVACSIAVLRFCDAMLVFCYHASLPDSAQSWRMSKKIYFALVLIPTIVL